MGDGKPQKSAMAYRAWNLVDQQQVIFQPKDIPKLIKLFKKCVGSDFSNKFISKTIESLISNNWQDEYQKVCLEELTDILFDCSKNNSSKNYVANAVDMLISKCCVAQKLISKIINILSDFLYDSRENGEFIASSIKNSTILGLLNECEKAKISNIFKMLDKCSASEHEDVVWAIKDLYEKDLLGKRNKEQVFNAINVLNECVSSAGVTTAVIANELFEELFTKSFLESISDSKQIPKIANQLSCFLSQGAGKTVVLNLVKKLI